MAVRFRLLGAIEATVDGKPISLGHAQLRCLLTVLLIEANRPVSVDQLIDRVWAARRLPNQPRRAVQHTIPLLRRVLAPAPGVTLARSGPGYQLSTDPDTIDLHRFLALLAQAQDGTNDDESAALLLEQALLLRQGEPFADLVTDTPWLQIQRATITAHHHAARLDLTDIRLRQGRHAAVLAELATQTTDHPLDERLAGQYLLALYRSGRQAEALEHYHRLQHRLAEELGADPSPPLQELHRQILTAEATLAPSGNGTRAAVTVPRQLPAAPQGFVGRAGELAQLDKELDAQATSGAGMVVWAIAGAGGMGKSWLALHWAHQHLDRFPDGQLQVDLRGFDPSGEPLSPDVAIRGFLAALGVRPGEIPAEPAAALGQYRSELAGKRLLILLDNARDTAQVAPLLPGGSGCVVLVTSRDRLSGLVAAHGARRLAVDVLPELTARQVLVSRVGVERVAAEPDIADELLGRCGGVPLALSILAGRIDAQPRFPLAALASELRAAATELDALDDGDPIASLPAVQSWSYQALSHEQARMFGLLGLAPGPDIALPAAAALTALPVRRARTVLRDLENISLVQQHLPGRYRMHDLTRLYAAEQAGHDLSEVDRTDALRRLVDFHLHSSYAGERTLHPHGSQLTLDPPAPGCQPLSFTSQEQALDWLVAEHAGILASQQLAAAHGWHTAVWQLAWCLHEVHYRRGYLADSLASWQAGLTAAEQLADPAVLVVAHRSLGHAYSRLSQRVDGRSHMEQALRYADQTDDLDARASTHHVLASTCAGLEDFPAALDHAEAAVRLYRAMDHPVGEADALTAVGLFGIQLGRYAEARTACERALVLARRHEDADSEGDALEVLGVVAHAEGRHAEAVAHYSAALALFRRRGNTFAEAVALGRLGEAHAELGEPADAHAAWLQALALNRELHRTVEADRVERLLADLDSR